MTATTLATHQLGGVLWDMDGTLIDTEPLWLKSELAMLDRFGIEMSEQTQVAMVGSGLRDAARHFQLLGVPMGIDEIIAEWVSEVSSGLAVAGPKWRPGARQLLASLGAARIPCALVTMSVRSLAEEVVSLLPEGTFAAIIAGDEVQNEKPHPEPYFLGAQALGIEIATCLALEDSPTGLRSAHSSGAVAIGVPHLVPLNAAPAHALFSSLAGLDARQLQLEFSELRSREQDLTTTAIVQEPAP